MIRSYRSMIDSIINEIRVDANKEEERDIIPDFIFMTLTVFKKLKKEYSKEFPDQTALLKHAELTYIGGIRMQVGEVNECLRLSRMAIVMGSISILIVDEGEVEHDG